MNDYLGATCIAIFSGFILFVLIFNNILLTNPSVSKRILVENGYHEIKTGNYAWFACAKDDWYQTKFTAISPSGAEVSGAVCCGLIFKNCTIRFN